MNRRIFLWSATLPLAAQPTPPNWVYDSEDAHVTFIPDERGPYLPAIQMKRAVDADKIILTAFYYETRVIDGRAVRLLLSATSIAPYAGTHGVGGGDLIRLPRRPEFVRLELLKSVAQMKVKPLSTE